MHLWVLGVPTSLPIVNGHSAPNEGNDMDKQERRRRELAAAIKWNSYPQLQVYTVEELVALGPVDVTDRIGTAFYFILSDGSHGLCDPEA